MTNKDNQSIFIGFGGYNYIKEITSMFFNRDGSIKYASVEYGDRIKLYDYLMALNYQFIKYSDNSKLTSDEWNLSEATWEKSKNISVDSATDLTQKLYVLLKDESLLIRRWFLYIPRGIFFEEEFASLNQNLKQTSGWLDTDAKVDFIDEKNKILYSLKSTNSLDLFKLIRQIRAKINTGNYSDYKINIVWNKPLEGKTIIVEE